MMELSMLRQLYEIYKQHPHVCTDTRQISEGVIFFCLKGERFDGNQFAQEAAARGAACVVTSDPRWQNVSPFFVVADTLVALQQLARYHRQQLQIPIIGITGTNGKTTTKELIASVLQTKYRVTFTQGNLNNHIGVPLTLLSITPDTEIAIVEMGANHAGEIATLCDLALPNYGIITNIGTAHLEGFGSIETVYETKKQLFDHVRRNGGTLFVNVDDPRLLNYPATEQVSAWIPYGTGNFPLLCRGRIATMNPFLTIEVADNRTDGGTMRLRTHLTGDYNLPNILCALTVGQQLGVPLEEAVVAIENYVPTNHRSQVVEAGSNTILADYYNANPTSMRAALHNLAKLSHPNKLAILGDMLELGSASRAEHQQIVALCAELQIPVWLVGKEFSALEISNIPTFLDVAALNQYLTQNPITHSLVLVKGSRGIHLECLFNA